MLSLSIRTVMEARSLVVAPPHASVRDASRLMRDGKVGAVLVTEDDRLTGIFTERDVVYRVIAAGRDPATTVLREVMTPDPKTVAPDESFGFALLLMHENGFRHAPVVENGKVLGVVSARNALDPELEEFVAEAERRRHIRRHA